MSSECNKLVEKRVYQALEEVIDPELGIDLVNLGLIYDIRVQNEVCKITMTLTIMGCPLEDVLEKQIKEAALSIEGVNNCKINLVWEPAWSIDCMSRFARLTLGIHY
ncbi:metal-sulfur cluster assembly factor [Bombilactobacillus bombi]|uniref:metal-sulfur cluster assembly factor n=1 Tax=Bombilactobacillus bombi TaxID=1303590 RepID=UPI0015E60051|nr:metal-sulfur cluster assembly factor [Bombilactobacillus bombi]MBA1434537.1 metal-sulfur cluster assembly factor [Bombilactobacillus bombi]